MKNKKAIEMNFAWIFAILIVAMIIALAIYGAVRLVSVEKKSRDSATAKELSVLLTPLETNLESSVTTPLQFSQETRVYNKCDLNGNFGTQSISTSTSSGIGNKWNNPGVPSKFYNKYFFSSDPVEGTKMYALSRPLFMPYKIADLIYLWSEKQKYCFVNPPNDIENDASSMIGVNISYSKEDCPLNSILVCFTSSGCDIDVSISSRTVKHKAQKTEYYVDTDNNALLYAAIFSDPVLYECQLQRLWFRASELALLYASKSESLGTRGCTSQSLQAELVSYASLTKNKNSSINSISFMSSQIADDNKALGCKLF